MHVQPIAGGENVTVICGGKSYPYDGQPSDKDHDVMIYLRRTGDRNIMGVIRASGITIYRPGRHLDHIERCGNRPTWHQL